MQSHFYNYLLYKNLESGLLAESTGNVLFSNFTLAENRHAGMEFFQTDLTNHNVVAEDMAIIGQTSNNAESVSGAKGVIMPRSSKWYLNNIRFYNFPSGTLAMETCSGCNSPSAFLSLSL